MFIVDNDPNKNGNGDICIRTDKGRLVALIYARRPPEPETHVANVIAAALNSAFSPSHTDMMVTTEQLDRFLEQNLLPDDADPNA